MKYIISFLLISIYISPLHAYELVGRIPQLNRPLSYKKINEFIIKHQIDNLDDLISYLPSTYFRNYVLMHTSHSAQRESASYKYPRVIAYDPSSSLMISFTGDERHSDYNKLELMEWNYKTLKFEFSEIEFPKDSQKKFNPQSLSSPYETWPDYTSLVKFNHKKADCSRCHGDNPKPIWDRYDKWPGAYGSFDDLIFKQSAIKNYSDLPNINNLDALLRISQEEVDDVWSDSIQFHKNKRFWSKHIRYKNLVFPKGRKTSPYNDRPRDDRSDNLVFRPNLRFTNHIMNLMAKSFLSFLKSNKTLYQRYRYLFLYGNTYCDDSPLEKFISKKSKIVDLNPYTHLLYGPSDELAEVFGFDPKFWGPLPMSDKVFFDGEEYGLDYRVPVWSLKELAKEDKKLMSMLRHLENFRPHQIRDTEDCLYIGNLVLKSLENWIKDQKKSSSKKSVKTNSEDRSLNPLKRNCLGCHMEKRKINFDKTESLDAKVIEKSIQMVRQGKMPYQLKLHKKDKEEVLNYLENLIKK